MKPFFQIEKDNINEVSLILFLDVILESYKINHDTLSNNYFTQYLINQFCIYISRSIALDSILFNPYKKCRNLTVKIKTNAIWSQYIFIVIYSIAFLCNNSNLKLKMLHTISPISSYQSKTINPDEIKFYLRGFLNLGFKHVKERSLYLESNSIDKLKLIIKSEFNKLMKNKSDLLKCFNKHIKIKEIYLLIKSYL